MRLGLTLTLLAFAALCVGMLQPPSAEKPGYAKVYALDAQTFKPSADAFPRNGHILQAFKPENGGASCDYTPLNFSLSGGGVVGATRAFSVTQGDTFSQFVAPPITATASSLAYVTVNDGFSGSVSGGITGTFTLTNLNGIMVTGPEGFGSAPRGSQLHNIVIQGASGTITAALVMNFVALTSSPPYYPRGFTGFMHSIETSGSYAPYRYVAPIAGTVFQGITGGLVINGSTTLLGRLYSGGGSLNETIFGLREAPSVRAATFDAADVIAQFTRPDFFVGAAAPGTVNPRTSFVGTAGGTINGGFLLDPNSVVAAGGPNSGRGWFAGEFTFSNTDAEILTGPWVSDRTNNSLSGYVWQALGTGVYSDSLMFGSFSGTLLGGSTVAGSISGVYCQGSQIPTPTATRTPTGAATPTSTATSPATATGTSQATGTDTPAATETATQVATATGTLPPATSTSTPTASLTGTACAITFTDVAPTDYFYEPVRYLFCLGAISGYGDNTFRPYSNTTRGQVAKIVVFAEGWPIDTTGGPHFNDVPGSNPFYPFIETAYNRQIISGYACGGPGEPCPGLYFRWGNNVTRAQLCKIVVLAEGWPIDTTGGPHFADVPQDNAFYGHVETAYNRGIISGYGDVFLPGSPATRGQISKIVYNSLLAGP